MFCRAEFLVSEGARIFGELRAEDGLRALLHAQFCERLAYYFGEINALHPFREGNGRSQRVLLEALARQAGYVLDFKTVSPKRMVQISREAQEGRLPGAIACFQAAVSPAPSRPRP